MWKRFVSWHYNSRRGIKLKDRQDFKSLDGSVQLGTGDPLKFPNKHPILILSFKAKRSVTKKVPLVLKWTLFERKRVKWRILLRLWPSSLWLYNPRYSSKRTNSNTIEYMNGGGTNKKTCAVQHIVNVFPLLSVFIIDVSKQTRPFFSIPRAVQKNLIGSFQINLKRKSNFSGQCLVCFVFKMILNLLPHVLMWRRHTQRSTGGLSLSIKTTRLTDVV